MKDKQHNDSEGERDVVSEVEELLAKASVHALYHRETHRNRDVADLLRRLVDEVRRLRLKVDAITEARIQDLAKEDDDD